MTRRTLAARWFALSCAALLLGACTTSTVVVEGTSSDTAETDVRVDASVLSPLAAGSEGFRHVVEQLKANWDATREDAIALGAYDALRQGRAFQASWRGKSGSFDVELSPMAETDAAGFEALAKLSVVRKRYPQLLEEPIASLVNPGNSEVNLTLWLRKAGDPVFEYGGWVQLRHLHGRAAHPSIAFAEKFQDEGLFRKLQDELAAVLPGRGIDTLVSLTHDENRRSILRTMIGSELFPVHYQASEGLIIVAKGLTEESRALLDRLQAANGLPDDIKQLIADYSWK